MKIRQMIKEFGVSRKRIAESVGLTEQALNNFVSQDREVLELANGDYVLKTSRTKIFKRPT